MAGEVRRRAGGAKRRGRGERAELFRASALAPPATTRLLSSSVSFHQSSYNGKSILATTHLQPAPASTRHPPPPATARGCATSAEHRPRTHSPTADNHTRSLRTNARETGRGKLGSYSLGTPTTRGTASSRPPRLATSQHSADFNNPQHHQGGVQRLTQVILPPLNRRLPPRPTSSSQRSQRCSAAPDPAVVSPRSASSSWTTSPAPSSGQSAPRVCVLAEEEVLLRRARGKRGPRLTPPDCPRKQERQGPGP